MKTLEERLRDAKRNEPWEIRLPVVLLSDALAIVADAPRIYRGEGMDWRRLNKEHSERFLTDEQLDFIDGMRTGRCSSGGRNGNLESDIWAMGQVIENIPIAHSIQTSALTLMGGEFGDMVRALCAKNLSPRVYLADSIKDAPAGEYAMGWMDPCFPALGVSWNGIIKHPSHNTEAWKDRIFVGPLPTNSPGEGKG